MLQITSNLDVELQVRVGHCLKPGARAATLRTSLPHLPLCFLVLRRFSKMARIVCLLLALVASASAFLPMARPLTRAAPVAAVE
jgi:hypothetical protein